ncbi:MAG: hypothetical protein VCF24_24350 [Candidatus Latescibacterota bacterium]
MAGLISVRVLARAGPLQLVHLMDCASIGTGVYRRRYLQEAVESGRQGTASTECVGQAGDIVGDGPRVMPGVSLNEGTSP